MLSKHLFTFGQRLAHQKSVFKGPMLRASLEPECDTAIPHAEKTVSTMQLPAYIDPKCVLQEAVYEGKEQPKSYDYKYHAYSLYDLNEATTRLAEQQTKKKDNN
ncbi:uncharacterized protein LOC117581808 [Drosophila guanche]|uniref:uncharacterized protein LOC117581808 n=1 Tax=Drosophila guanche TaxID=7266 RepID=UPI00147122B0|nr:uncharacterized protein LOC117581808 [Drosophila guanche]